MGGQAPFHPWPSAQSPRRWTRHRPPGACPLRSPPLTSLAWHHLSAGSSSASGRRPPASTPRCSAAFRPRRVRVRVRVRNHDRDRVRLRRGRVHHLRGCDDNCRRRRLLCVWRDDAGRRRSRPACSRLFWAPCSPCSPAAEIMNGAGGEVSHRSTGHRNSRKWAASAAAGRALLAVRRRRHHCCDSHRGCRPLFSSSRPPPPRGGRRRHGGAATSGGAQAPAAVPVSPSAPTRSPPPPPPGTRGRGDDAEVTRSRSRCSVSCLLDARAPARGVTFSRHRAGAGRHRRSHRCCSPC